ncbi:MAG: P1 family peptidase, partial [Deltaproteobacteria bacterium]|nr:P1 family peptidase [Deltaproteobacteria bacterium]
MAGIERAMKTGLGSAGFEAGGIKVAALVAANPVGDIVDPDTGEILAGVRSPDGRTISGTMTAINSGQGFLAPPPSNTVLGVVATEARLTKLQVARAARMAACGFARAIRPTSTLHDGDMVFVLATGKGPAVDENIIGALGAEALAQAIAAAARTATGIPGIPAYRDLVHP